MPRFSQVSEQQAIELVVQRLMELLQCAPEQAAVRRNVQLGLQEIDALVEAPAHTFAIEFKANSSLATIVKGIDQVRSLLPTTTRGQWLPLIATRFMTPAGKQHCQEAGISWMDLAGNAHIEGKGLYVHVEGHPNTFKPQGRPSSVFAPKSSRIARWLLIYPDQFSSENWLRPPRWMRVSPAESSPDLKMNGWSGETGKARSE